MIKIQVKVNQVIEKVWDAYYDPKARIVWNHASDDWETPTSSVNLRVGGTFSDHFQAKDKSFEFDFEGEFTYIETPHRVEYKMGDGRKVITQFTQDKDCTIITQEFDAEDSNSTEQQREGWQNILNNFAKYIDEDKNKNSKK